MSPFLLLTFILGMCTSVRALRPFLSLLLYISLMIAICYYLSLRRRMLRTMWGQLWSLMILYRGRIGGVSTSCCYVLHWTHLWQYILHSILMTCFNIQYNLSKLIFLGPPMPINLQRLLIYECLMGVCNRVGTACAD